MELFIDSYRPGMKVHVRFLLQISTELSQEKIMYFLLNSGQWENYNIAGKLFFF